MAVLNPWFLLTLAVLCKADWEGPPVSRIAFGSCSNQSAPQPIWNAVNNFNPQIFIWLGDNVYGDNRRPFQIFGKERTVGPWKNTPRFVPVTKEELEMRFNTAKSNPGYTRLRERAQIIGTWDDHDYGLNDAGKEFSGKNISQNLLLDFLDEPQESPRRKQAGVYTSCMFGPQGKRIKVILLDTRYHRDPLFSDGTILGDSQWKWLEEELDGPESQLTIIASSIQVVSNLSATTNPMFHLESWGRFPKERNRLYKMIADSKRDGVIFISGDVHYGEIARYDCGVGYSLYDITSSGLTQAVEKVVPSQLAFLVRIGAWVTPTTMRVFNHQCHYTSCTYGQPNFGTIEIDWNADPVNVRAGVRDMNGDYAISIKFSLTDLQVLDDYTKRITRSGKTQRHCTLETGLPWIIRYRLAIVFYSAVSALVLMLVLLAYAAVSFGLKLFGKYKLD